MFFIEFALIIAIDGPSGAGKGTIATYLANFYNLKHLDTGLLYRAVALRAFCENVSIENRSALVSFALSVDMDNLKDPSLRDEATANIASKIAVLPEIRETLTRQMHLFCKSITKPYRGVVLDGRDIGTVVCPDAHLKFFITADDEVRAQRRHKEMQQRNQEIKEPLIEKIKERDARDSGRSIAPLTPAKDAYTIDTTHMSIQEACRVAGQLIDDYLEANQEKKNSK